MTSVSFHTNNTGYLSDGKELKLQEEKIKEKEEQLDLKAKELDRMKETWLKEKELLIKEKGDVINNLEKQFITERDLLHRSNVTELQQLEKQLRQQQEAAELTWKKEKEALITWHNSKLENERVQWKKDREELIITTMQQTEALRAQLAKERSERADRYHTAEQEWHKESSLGKGPVASNTIKGLSNVLRSTVYSNTEEEEEELHELIEELTLEYETKMQIEQSTWRIKEQELRNENEKQKVLLDESMTQCEQLRQAFEDQHLKYVQVDRELGDTKLLLQKTQRGKMCLI